MLLSEVKSINIANKCFGTVKIKEGVIDRLLDKYVFNILNNYINKTDTLSKFISENIDYKNYKKFLSDEAVFIRNPDYYVKKYCDIIPTLQDLIKILYSMHDEFDSTYINQLALNELLAKHSKCENSIKNKTASINALIKKIDDNYLKYFDKNIYERYEKVVNENKKITIKTMFNSDMIQELVKLGEDCIDNNVKYKSGNEIEIFVNNTCDLVVKFENTQNFLEQFMLELIKIENLNSINIEVNINYEL